MSRVVSFLASLKLAVLVILSIAFACATATVLESLYDIPTARYWVYEAFWFRAILIVFGINILSVMIDRFPWKRKHIAFLFAHAGILTLLFGSWLTDRAGVDGSLRISEGQSESIIEMNQLMLVFSEGQQVRSFPLKWIPSEVKFRPFSVKDRGLPYDIRVTNFMTHADPIFDFVPKPPMPAGFSGDTPPRAALKITVSGGPMRITQDFWLWTGDPSTQAFQAGPAWLELVDRRTPGAITQTGPEHGPKLSFRVEKGGVISYRAISSSREVVEGRVPLRALAGHEIDPHWKAVKVTLKEFVPDAWVNTTYKPSRIQHGDMAPPSAIQVVAGEGNADVAGVWLGLGSRALLRANGHDVEVGYFHRRLMLPFSVRLDHFTVERYQGTVNPASYASKVTILGNSPFERLISMNEPLEHMGFTLYQSSYEDALPRPVTSILSVNRDPGRRWKYLGSLLIVIGSIWLFAQKYRQRKKVA